ncbi:MAG: hypothetical protein WCV55_02995 [Candidatus Paceibacterota bacterium]
MKNFLRNNVLSSLRKYIARSFSSDWVKIGLDSLKDKKEQILLSTVIIFVALSSFALGRYSLENHTEAQFSSTSSQTGNYQAKTTRENTNIPSDGSFVASKSGTKYYLSTCSGANKISSKNKIYFKTESEAQSAGYSRASNCSF